MSLVFDFESASTADLIPGSIYKGGSIGTIADEPISKLLGVGNAGGFRFKGPAGSNRFVVLYSTGQEEHWPDTGVSEGNEIIYFGDNRTAGTQINKTPHGGNLILERAFASARDGDRLAETPIFIFMRKTGQGRDAELLCIAMPKPVTHAGEEGLVVTRRNTPDGVVLNYEATFEVVEVSKWDRNSFNKFADLNNSEYLEFAPPEIRSWMGLPNEGRSEPSRLQMADAQGHMIQELNIRPRTAMLDIFESISYQYWFALGELVDNSISSFMEQREINPEKYSDRKLIIKIYWDKASKTIHVEDNAAGIPLGVDGWDRVLEVGKRKTNSKYLSVYGYGLKAAALWWSPKLTIESKVEGELVSRTAILDKKSIGDSTTTPLYERPEKADHHYTRITLTGLNQGRSIPTAGSVSRIQDYLQSMYRVFLRGEEDKYQNSEGEPWLEIKVQNRWLKAELPELLEQPFWTKTGPVPGSPLVRWRTPTLSIQVKSQETGEMRTITGWVGILKKGKPNDAGFLMLFRGKGITGVGQGVGSESDLYRPTYIVGSGNTNRRQRFVGEFDISEFGKTVTSNEVKWTPEEEQEFLEKLKKELTRPEFDIWSMAENWRPSKLEEMTSGAAATYSKAADDAVEAVEKEAQRPNSVLNNGALRDSGVEVPAVVDTTSETSGSSTGEDAFDKTFTISGQKYRFVGTMAGVAARFISVFPSTDEVLIQINQDHPFMRAFAWVPGHDPKAIYRLALAIALADLNAGQNNQRMYINNLLDGPMGQTTWDGEEL